VYNGLFKLIDWNWSISVAFEPMSVTMAVSTDEERDDVDAGGTEFNKELTAAELMLELVFDSIIKFRII
jgi:hypothetical protein